MTAMTFELNAIAQASALRGFGYTVVDCLLEGTFIALFAGAILRDLSAPAVGRTVCSMVFRTGRDRGSTVVGCCVAAARRQHFCRSGEPLGDQRAGFVGHSISLPLGRRSRRGN